MQRGDGVGQCVVVLRDRGQQRAEAVDHLVERVVALGEVGGEIGRLLDQVVDAGALSLQHADDLVGQVVDLLRGQPAEQWPEAVEQRGQADRGLGAVLRDRGAPVQGRAAGTALGQREVALTQQVGVPHDGPGVVGQLLVVVGGEGHLHVRGVEQLLVDHLADRDSRGADAVAGLQAGDAVGAAEDRVIGPGGADVRPGERVELHDAHDEGHDDERGQLDDDRLLHFTTTVVAPRSSGPRIRSTTPGICDSGRPVIVLAAPRTARTSRGLPIDEAVPP